MFSELEDLARRLEQQLVSYERLHMDEMIKFQDQFQAFQRIQADELQMLRKELDQLKQEIAALKQEEMNRAPAAMSSQAAPARREQTITRRDLLTGKIPIFDPKQS